MKKNWVLRLGLLAMVLTLVTMPMVSSTYAKYVTEAAGTDTARVAKWGVVMSTTADDIFGEAYLAATGLQTTRSTSTPVEATISVNADSSDIENLLAPGTNGSFTFSLTGKPEVALNLAISANPVVLTGWTVNSTAYEPVIFTLQNGSYYFNGTDWTTTVDTLSAAELQTGLLTFNKGDLPANTDLMTISNTNATTGVYTVTWEWEFENSLGGDTTWLFLNTDLYTYDGTDYTAATSTYDSGETYYTESAGVYTAVTNMAPYLVTYNEADTALGLLGSATLEFDFTITATQID